MIRRITQIAATAVDDGVSFEPGTLTTVPIRQDDEYHGLRLAMNATLSHARLKQQLDVSFGDPVTPAPALIEYPQFLTDETFTLYGYPIATAIALGDLNTRDRDYADLHQLITRHHLDGDELTTALPNTASHRGIQLGPFSEAISDLATRPQAALGLDASLSGQHWSSFLLRRPARHGSRPGRSGCRAARSVEPACRPSASEVVISGTCAGGGPAAGRGRFGDRG